MSTGVEKRPMSRGGVIGLGLGRFVYVGGGVRLAVTAWAGVLALTPAALAGPEGARVVAGEATIRQNGNRTVIRAADRTIIDYSRFDIAKGEVVRFVQPSAQARVLNRIDSADPTRIDGTLRANGAVYFLNPAGVVFGPDSVVNVNQLYAAAGQMSNRDFLDGTNRFTGLTGAVENHGRIEAGVAALVGANVANTGSIVTDKAGAAGVVAMVAGDQVVLSKHGEPMSVRVSPDNAQLLDPARPGVENTGTVRSMGGRVRVVAGDMYSLAIRDRGTTTAGDVKMQARGNGRVELAGTISTRNQAGTPEARTGGRVEITGKDVALRGATIDASGNAGGGTVLIGGGVQGRGTSQTAQTALIDADAVVRADAIGLGKGGTVVVWSDRHTGVYGDLSARGGAKGGDGGFVETSGKWTLDLRGAKVDASAADGRAGTWLLDPFNVRITAAGAGVDDLMGDTYTPTGNDAQVSADSISTALSTGASGTNVTITTGLAGSAGTQDGDLIVDAPITKNSATSATLTLEAARNINVNQAISSTGGGQLNVTLTSENGAVSVDAPVQTTGGSFSASGNSFASTTSITTSGGTANVAVTGAATVGGNIDAGAGLVNIDSGSTATISASVSGNGGVNISGTGLVDIRDAVSSSGRVVITGNDLDIGSTGSVTGTSAVVVQPAEDATGILLNSPGGGALSISNAELGRISTGGVLTIGGLNATGAIVIGGLGEIDLSARSFDVAIRGGEMVFSSDSGAGGITIRDDGRLTLLSRASIVSAARNAPDVTIGGSINTTGGLLVRGQTGVTLRTDVARISGRAESGDITITNTGGAGSALEIVDLSFVDPIVSSITINNEGLRTGQTRTIVLNTDGALVMTSTIGAPRGTVNVTADGNIFVLAGSAPSITADTLTITSTNGLIGVGGPLRTAVGSLVTPGTLIASAEGAIDIDNSSAMAPLGSVALTIDTDQQARLVNAGEITSSGLTPWTAGSFDIRTTVGGITLREDVTARSGNVDLRAVSTVSVQTDAAVSAPAGAVNFTAGDLELAGSVAGLIVRINNDAADGSIGLGGATGNISLSNAELNRFDTPELEIGGSNTRQVTVAGVTLTGEDAPDLVRLAPGSGSGIVFFNGPASSFRTAEILGRAGVTLESNVTTTVGRLFIDGDADDTAAPVGTGLGDRLTIGPGVTLDAATELTLKSLTGDITGAGAVTLRGADGVTIRDSYTNTAGDTTINADTNATGPGLFTTASGANITVGATGSGRAVRVTAADVSLGGNLTAVDGEVALTRSTRGEIWLGDPTGAPAGAFVLEQPELARIEARTATFGGTTASLITVNGLINNSAGQTDADRMRVTGSIVLRTDDLAVTPAGLTGGQAGVTIARASAGTVGLGTATGDLTIDAGEIARITATGLRVSNLDTAATPDNTGRTITVQDVDESLFTTVGGNVTFEAGGLLSLIDTGGGGGGGAGRFRFTSLGALSNTGVEVRANLTTTTGDLTINADLDNSGGTDDRVRFFSGRSAVSGRDLIIDGATGDSEGPLTLTAARDVAIRSNFLVNGDLTVRADSDANGAGTFEIGVGNTVRSDSNNIAITAADIRFGASSSAANAVSLNAGGGRVSIERTTRGTISLGSFDQAATAASASDPMTISNDELGRIIATGLTLGGENTSLVRVEGVTDAASNRIAGTTVLRALGPTGNINFDNTASTFNALRAEASSAVNVNRALTADTGGVVLDGGAGTAEFGDGLVNIGANVSGGGQVRVRSAAVLTGQDIAVRGNSVRFDSTIDSDTAAARALTVDSAGNGQTVFAGNIGSTRRLASLRTNADGSVRIGGDVLASTEITFNDDAVITAASPTIETTGGTGVTFGDRATVRGRVQAVGPSGQVRFLGGTELSGNLVVNAIGGGDVTFAQRVFAQDGRFNLSANVTASSDAPTAAGQLPPRIPTIRFGGDVGTDLQGRSARLGTVRLNADAGRVTVPRQATIGTTTTASSGLAFNLSGDFIVGQNEKISVVGPLTINANKITVGDISASGDVTLTARSNAADAITILRRERQRLLRVNFNPSSTADQQTLASNLLLDDGTDIISTFGRVTFSDRPRLAGAGPTPRIGTGAGEVGGDPSVYAGLLIREFQVGETVPAARAGEVLRNGERLLDLTPTGSSTASYATVLAEIPPDQTAPTVAPVDPAVGDLAVAVLSDLGVTTRGATRQEQYDLLFGAATFDDSGALSNSGEPVGGAAGGVIASDRAVVANRLSARSSVALANAYQRVFGDVENSGQGVAAVRAAISASVDRYRQGEASEGGRAASTIDPLRFRAYLERTPGERETLDAVLGVGEVLEHLSRLGLGTAEEERVRGRLLGRLQPEGEPFGRDLRTFERVFISTSRAAR